MPTYEYRCDNCAKNFDVVQSFQDEALTECPTCGEPVRKVFGSVGIVFKGSGFYKTDSRSGGSSSRTADPGTSGSDSGGDSSSDAATPAASTSTSASDSTGSTSTSTSTTPSSTDKPGKKDKATKAASTSTN